MLVVWVVVWGGRTCVRSAPPGWGDIGLIVEGEGDSEKVRSGLGLSLGGELGWW